MAATFFPTPGPDGYYLSLDRRWKAAEHRDGITLTDTTGRARFPQNNDERWLRLPDWAAAREVISAF